MPSSSRRSSHKKASSTRRSSSRSTSSGNLYAKRSSAKAASRPPPSAEIDELFIIPEPTILMNAPMPETKYDFRGCQAYIDSLYENRRRFSRRLAIVEEELKKPNMQNFNIKQPVYRTLKKRLKKMIVVLTEGMEEIRRKIPTVRNPIKLIGTTAIPNMGTELLVDSECGELYDKTFERLRRI